MALFLSIQNFIFLMYLLLSSSTASSPNITKFHHMTRCFPQNSYDWDMQAQTYCGTSDQYHCLQDSDGSFNFYEFCRQLLIISPGKYPAFDRNHRDITAKECPENTFQDKRMNSSLFNSCNQKAECNGMGQLVCDNGTNIANRRCKCDISKNMVVLVYGERPSNKKICCPYSSPSCSCWEMDCEYGEELNEVYQCVPICEANSYRPTWSSDCIPIKQENETTSISNLGITTSIDSTTANTRSTDTSSHVSSNMEGMKLHYLSVVPWVIAGFFFLLFLVFVIGLVKYCRHNHRNQDETEECSSTSIQLVMRSTTATQSENDPMMTPNVEHNEDDLDNQGGEQDSKSDKDPAATVAAIRIENENNSEQATRVEYHIHGDHRGDIYNIKIDKSKDIVVGRHPTLNVIKEQNNDNDNKKTEQV